MVDFNINLAKEIVSTYEERVGFYNRMILYLALCGAALVLSAYTAAGNIQRYVQNRAALRLEIATSSAVSGLDATVFRNPEKIYNELESGASQIASLRQALERQVQLLPVIHNLFIELPNGVYLQSLSAKQDSIVFGLVMPPGSTESSDLVRELRESWEENKSLMKRVINIRPGKAERRKVGSDMALYVEFECILRASR